MRIQVSEVYLTTKVTRVDPLLSDPPDCSSALRISACFVCLGLEGLSSILVVIIEITPEFNRRTKDPLHGPVLVYILVGIYISVLVTWSTPHIDRVRLSSSNCRSFWDFVYMYIILCKRNSFFLWRPSNRVSYSVIQCSTHRFTNTTTQKIFGKQENFNAEKPTITPARHPHWSL